MREVNLSNELNGLDSIIIEVKDFEVREFDVIEAVEDWLLLVG